MVKKYLKFIILFISIIVIIASYFVITKIESPNVNEEVIKEKIAYVETTSEESTSTSNNFYVDVKGEVKNPNVYMVSEGMLVIDAINLAGGFTKNAYTDNINLSKKLNNEMVIIVGNKKDYTTSTTIKVINDALIKEEKKDNTNKALVNINTASKEELMTITGIGESKANSIIEYRNKTKFNSIEDIKNISGIGDKFFEQIKNYITV
jgi:competence protein ComEA